MTAMVVLFAAAAMLSAAVVMARRTMKIMRRMDEMMGLAISGKFSEEVFSEERLSRLETKTRRYLIKGQTAQRRLEEDRENIKTTISDISHQTKTPIANILLYTQLLTENTELDDEARSIALQIGKQTEKLNFLIVSMIKMSRLESGIISVIPKENDIKELVHELYMKFMPQADALGRTLTISEEECDNDHTTAFFDFKWTVEALGNMIDNALKYTEEGGHVDLSVTYYQLFVRVDISDDGIGIEEEEQAKIFGRFYRSPEVDRKEGVGIGLYLAREIISREGGYIKVSSNHGSGSKFSVFLPKK